MKLRRLFVLAALGSALLGSSTTSEAGLLSFGNNAAGFNAQVAGDSLPLLGTEDFESSTLASNSIQVFDDSLTPGVANSVFPGGTNPALGMTVQSNTLGASPSSTSPRGSSGLVTASAGYLSTPSDQISNNSPGDSFDLVFSPAVKAVGLSPLFFAQAPTTPTSDPGTIEFEVFSSANVSLGTFSLASVDFSQTDFMGIVATGSDNIGRINLYAVGDLYAGADDIRAYAAVPEPSTFVTAALGLLGLGCIARRRK